VLAPGRTVRMLGDYFGDDNSIIPAIWARRVFLSGMILVTPF
jgi:hypothetical protein